MVDAGFFTAAIQLAVVINEISRAAQSNKVSCMAINHRIQIANEIIKTAFEKHKVNPKSIVLSESAFKLYFQLLERMRDFVAEISKRKTFSKLFYALRFRDEFDMLLRDFDSCVLDLNLGIALRTQAQLETDRNALEEDIIELKDFRKELQNGMDTLGGQLVGIRQMIATNRPMEDILAMVEIDYRQILDITPSETRKGRTFPVHKRAWLGQEVAEKPLGFFGSKDMLDMLKSEVAILKKLDRCNYITKFMGVTNRNNQISIIMEWLPNGDLASSLAKGDMDWEQKLFIAADIARGLMFLHEVGIIHKTLRAKNILLTRFNQAKITNFRQSRLESAQTRPMSDPFSFVRWLAPEKMTPKDVRYGAECDIYSFGMLLFEIASNRVPFIDYSDRELPELIVLKDLYETVPQGTPQEFADIMTACWSHDSRLRPTTSQVLLILRDACIQYENGQQAFGGLATNMKNPAPLFAVSPPTPMMSQVHPISPPITPISPKVGMLTPEVWNNPYVNKRYVEESMEELQRQQQQQRPTQQQQQQQQQQQHTVQSQPSQNRQSSLSHPQLKQLQMQRQLQQQQQQLLQQQKQQQQQRQQEEQQLTRAQQSPQRQHQSPHLQNQSLNLPRQTSQTSQTSHSQPQQPTSHNQYQQAATGPKQEYFGLEQPVLSNTLPRTPRPQSEATSPVQTQGFSQPKNVALPTSLGPPKDTQAHSPVPMHITPPSQPSTPPAPLVNRNTRPLGIRRKKISQAMAEDLNRLSLQDAPEELNTTATTPLMIKNNARNSSPTMTSNYNSRFSNDHGNGSVPSSHGDTVRPQSASHSPVTPLPSSYNIPSTMAQALLHHESYERERAWRIFKAYCDQGHPEGMYWTGYYLFHGEGGQIQNRQRAFELFRAVTLMDLGPDLQGLAANAYFYTAVCYLEGHGVERNHRSGFGHMEKAADFGNAFAQFLVGDAYHKGSAIIQANVQRRDHYWQLAARQKEQRAMEQCRRLGIPF